MNSKTPPDPGAPHPGPNPDSRFLCGLPVCLLILFSGPLIFLAWIWSYSFTPATPGGYLEQVDVVIPSGATFSDVQDILTDSGLIEKDFRFGVVARLMGISRQLKAGEYRIPGNLSPYDILAILEKGMTFTRTITIPYGKNIKIVADILEKSDRLDKDEFLSAARDPALLKSFDVEADSFEGYLFPDTYHFPRGQTPQTIITIMVNQLRQILTQLHYDGSKHHGLSLHEILTLASIVEKETAVHQEKPLVAAVFLNRLRKGMRLQADPTVIYGIADFNGDLTFKDLKTLTPYNTYKIRGLPPGPITNPGEESIAAVLQAAAQGENKAESGFLYFVSRNDGTHFFSKTLAEHNKAVKEYQKKKH